MVLSATLAAYSSGVICLLSPDIRCALGSACTTYHISVLPFEPLCLSAASVSSGCTWIERSLHASMNLTRRGNSVPVEAYTFSPSRAPLYSSASEVIVLPSRGPSETTDSLPLTPDNSQLSPMFFCPVFTPLKGAIFSPPQTTDLKMFLNLSGYILVAIN